MFFFLCKKLIVKFIAHIIIYKKLFMIINRSFIYIQFHLEKITLQEQVSYLYNNQFTTAMKQLANQKYRNN